MNHDPKELRDAFERAAPEGFQLTYRAMFGGFMAYADGRPLASLSNVGIGLKCSPEDRDELLMDHDAGMLQYEPDAPLSKTYVALPDALVADEAALSDWIGRAAMFVASAPLKAKRSRK